METNKRGENMRYYIKLKSGECYDFVNYRDFFLKDGIITIDVQYFERQPYRGIALWLRTIEETNISEMG